MALQKQGYNPVNYYCNNDKLKAALDYIEKGIGGQQFDNVYRTITGMDTYMALADFNDYCAAQEKASALYGDKELWNKMSLRNIAESGIFAADRSINDYAKNIWKVNPLK
jgi:starch phosphorylase